MNRCNGPPAAYTRREENISDLKQDSDCFSVMETSARNIETAFVMSEIQHNTAATDHLTTDAEDDMTKR